jgi:hypothetical protein
MELDFRYRELVLPGGVTLRCKPMTQGQVQRWLVAGPRSTAPDVLADPQLAAATLEILHDCVVAVEGLTVKTQDGLSRPGTVDDFVTAGGMVGLVWMIRAVGELFKASGLSAEDVGNWQGPPTAPAPGAGPTN